MESFRSIESQPIEEFTFAAETNDVDLKEAMPSPEAYRGCLVQAMKDSNRGNGFMSAEVMTTVIGSRGDNLAMACGRCGITMVRDNGVTYGASKCPRVQSGQMSLGELA